MDAYGERLILALIGRRVKADFLPKAYRGKPMFSFLGEEMGMSPGDIHASRAYRIYVDYDETGIITDAELVVDGELISPCSGYWREELDEFDYPMILNWCLEHTD